MNGRSPGEAAGRFGLPLVALGPVLDWPDLEGAPLIINEATRSLPSPEFQRLARAARFSVRNVTSLVAMVQSGMGVTLLPALATVNLPAALTALPLRDPVCLRTVGLYWREGKVHSPLIRHFRAEFARTARVDADRLGLEAVAGTAD